MPDGSAGPPLIHFPDGTAAPVVDSRSLTAPAEAVLVDDKPLLLLDIDGVLLPFAPGEDHVAVRSLRTHTPLTFRVDLPQELAELHQRFTLVWATMWERRANALLGPALGLPELPTIIFDVYGRDVLTAKLPAVQAFVGDRPFAWADDSLESDAHAWADSRGAPSLLVDVDPRTGLTGVHVERLHRFAARRG